MSTTTSRPKILGVLTTLVVAASLLMAGPTEAAARTIVEEGESIQAALDAAYPGSAVFVRGDHAENVWINKSGMSLVGLDGATLRMPEEPNVVPCQNPENLQQAAIVCVHPAVDFAAGPPVLANNLDGVRVQNLQLEAPNGIGIESVFTDGVDIFGNTVSGTECAGIQVVLADGFDINGNTVSDVADCNGINVIGSTKGRIVNNSASGVAFAAIGTSSTSSTMIRENSASGSCYGIVVTDDPDNGYGFLDADVEARNVRIRYNTVTANNLTCRPFGPEGGLGGGVGIVVGGADRVEVRGNTVTDHQVQGTDLAPAGIYAGDFPNFDGSTFAVSTDLIVVDNVVTNNSSDFGDVDLLLESEADPKRVANNVCGVSLPDPSWCSAS